MARQRITARPMSRRATFLAVLVFAALIYAALSIVTGAANQVATQVVDTVHTWTNLIAEALR